MKGHLLRRRLVFMFGSLLAFAAPSCSSGVGQQDVDAQVALGLKRLLAESTDPLDAYLALNSAVDARLARSDDVGATSAEIQETFHVILESDENRTRLLEASQNLGGAFVIEEVDSGLAAIPGLSAVPQIDPSIDTVVLFVNGLWNTPEGAATSRGALLRCLRLDGRFGRVAVGSYYNRSRLEACVPLPAETTFGSLISIVEKTGCLLGVAVEDPLIGVMSWLGLPVQPEDVADLTSLLRVLAQDNRKIVIVAHSDGNHVVQQALAELGTSLVLDDSRVFDAIGVVMVGSPIAPSEMPAGGINVPGRERVGWVGRLFDPFALVGFVSQFADPLWQDACGAEAESILRKANVLSGEFGRMSTLGLLDPLDQFLTDERRQTLLDLRTAASALHDAVAQTACEVSWLHGTPLLQTNPIENHLFVRGYLRGVTTKPEILREIVRIRDHLLSQSVTENLVSSADLVAASGSFVITSGEFEIAVSPQDDQGRFVGLSLPVDGFSFSSLLLTNVETDELFTIRATNTQVTGMVVDAPTAEFLTAVLLLDGSGSMVMNDPGGAGRRAGANVLFDHLSDNDEVAVVEFWTEPGFFFDTDTFDVLQSFTSDGTALRKAVEALRSDGGTPLHEAVLEGLQMLEDRLGLGGLIVLLTDGETTGTVRVEAAIEQAQAQAVPIFVIGLGEEVDFSELRQLATQTSGGFVEATDAASLEPTFEGVTTGIKTGRVTVFGRATFAALPPGRYTVAGALLTQDPNGGPPIPTDFEFTVDVDNPGP